MQCNNVEENPNLVACAQHISYELKNQCSFQYPIFMLFLLQLGYKKCGFKVLGVSQVSCTCIHIDELRKPSDTLPSLIEYVDQPLSSIFNVEVVKEEEEVSSVVMEEEVDTDVVDKELAVKMDIDSHSDSDVEEDIEIDQQKVAQAVSIINSCLQEAIKELNNIKAMDVKEVTELIKTMKDVLLCNSNGLYCFQLISILFSLKVLVNSQKIRKLKVLKNIKWYFTA